MAMTRLLASLCGASLFVASAAMAAEQRKEDYFSLDLSKAVLSPKPIGPPAAFEQLPVEANGERASEPRWAGEELKTEPRGVAVKDVAAPRRAANAASMTPKPSARTHLAHRHRNPLDAQAMDTRIQTWPCKSGGICNWKTVK
jgi:hypothetical protein